MGLGTQFYLDSYESENSIDNDDKLTKYYPLIDNLVIKLSVILKNRISHFFRNLIGSSLNKNISKNFHQDQIEKEEHLRILKIEILRSKLQTVVNILKSHLDTNLLTFLAKIKQKIELNKFFNKDDNYLYLLPKPKLYRFRIIYAYSRMLNVIKSYRYRIGTVLKNCLRQWQDFCYVINSKKNNVLQGYTGNNAAREQSLTQLVRILERFLVFKTSYKMSFYCLRYLLSNDEKFRKIINFSEKLKFIFTKRQKYTLSTLQEKILEAEFYEGLNYDIKNLQDIYSMNNENYRSLENAYQQSVVDHENNMQIQLNNYKLNRILKGLIFIHNKKIINIQLAQKFYIWKKSNLFMVSREQLLKMNVLSTKQKIFNGLNLLNNLFNNYIISSHTSYFVKVKLFERLLFKVKIRNTLYDYGLKYKKIPKMIFDGFLKEKLFIIRNTFDQLYSLRKILLTVITKKYSTSYSPIIKNIHLINIHIFNTVIFCFLKWKKFTTLCWMKKVFFRKNLINLLRQLNRKLRTVQSEFVAKLKLADSLRYLAEKRKSTYHLINFVKTVVLNFNLRRKLIISIVFHLLSNKTKFDRLMNKSSSTKLIMLYNQFSHKGIYYRGKFKSSFETWKRKTFRDKNKTSKKINCFVKIQWLYLNKYSKDLKFQFIKWRTNSYHLAELNVYSKSFKPRIDHYLIENQSKILQDFEKEDLQLNQQLMKYKNLGLSKTEILIINLYKKHHQMLNNYFKSWRARILSKINFTLLEILNQSEDIQNQNDALILIYRSKKKNYHKTIEDFSYVKINFCGYCAGDQFEIDYKSINMDEQFDNDTPVEASQVSQPENSLYKTFKTTSDLQDENFRLDSKEENFNRPILDTWAKRVSDAEGKIKNLQIIQETKMLEYENNIKMLEDKKKELLQIKERILKSQNLS